MTTKNFLRHSVLLIFMLLQCKTPLAHTHVNGDHVVEHAHLAVTVTPWSVEHPPHQADMVQIPHAEHHAAVVCAAPESSGSVMAMDDAKAGSRHEAIVLPEPFAIALAYSYSPPLLHAVCQHPAGQAPPA